MFQRGIILSVRYLGSSTLIDQGPSLKVDIPSSAFITLNPDVFLKAIQRQYPRFKSQEFLQRTGEVLRIKVQFEVLTE